MSPNSVCAVIVTFQPALDDLCNLGLVRTQVEELVIVDNGSSQATLRELREASSRLRFKLMENGENRGLAAGLNQGACWARAQGYEWVVFFDQDSVVTANFISTLLEAYLSSPLKEQLALVVPRYVDRRSGLPLRGRYDCGGELEFAMTSGSLMPLSFLERQGWFEESLFIGGIDFDYSLRLRAAGYKLAECREALLLHAPSSPRIHRVFGIKLFTTSNYSAVRRYYSERNRVWLRRKYFARFPLMCLDLYWSSIKEIIKILLAEKEKAKKLHYIGRGVWDGWRGRMGRNDSL
jgi:rhamnosyltransferase